VFENEYFPADLVLVSSLNTPTDDLKIIKPEELGICYVETKGLDGETNLKFRQAKTEISSKYLCEKDYANFSGSIECTLPNEMIYDFSAKYYPSEDNSEFIVVDKQSLLLRGCSLKQTYCIYGMVVYVGPDTKMLKNYPVFRYKVATIERQFNKHIYFLLIIDFLVSLGSGVYVYYNEEVNFDD
jgi:magnesium-transporting ATPase (P-type)